jgi:dipeptidyl aminopeptidase/acylaminoacyl peptidase
MGQSSNKLIYGVVLFAVAIIGVLIVADRPVPKAPAPGAQQLASDLTPDLPAPQQLENGIRLYDVHLMRAGVPMELWAYLPNPLPSGKLPCVLIAPAGSRLFHGMSLDVGDRVEHLPYVRRGFAVVAYQLDGTMQDQPTDAQARDAIAKFSDAHAGLDNAAAAINYIEAKIPQIDPKRIYSVGHSSAGTLALQVAQNDPRIAACVAFAPACDLGTRLKRAQRVLETLQSGSYDFFVKLSPDQNIARLKCPTMLFTAMDDRNVPTESVVAFATQLRHTNAHVKLVQVPTGGHYNAMIKQGIPAAIEWMGQLPAKTALRAE